jgi:hypothetical protein
MDHHHHTRTLQDPDILQVSRQHIFMIVDLGSATVRTYTIRAEENDKIN